MWATSDAFAVALASTSRVWATRIEVLYGTEVVTALNVLLRGYVGIDDVAVRRECHFTIVDADGVLTPASARDLLAPKGTELRVYRGLRVAGSNGPEYEWVPLGVFGIVEPEVRAHSDGTVIEVKGFDRVDTIRDRRFVDPWVIPDGTWVHDAIPAIVTSRLNVPVRVTATSPHQVPETVYDRYSDPWDAVRELAEACGYSAYFDQLGSLVVGPDIGVETGMTYEPGPDSLLMTSARRFDKSKTYSGVIVRGEHPDKTPVRVEKWDSDPKSPTYAFGPFGKRPYGYYSALVTTTAQAQQVADLLFPTVTRITQECTITIAGHPGHDVGDVITIVDPRSKTTGRWQITSGTIPLRVEQGEHTRLRCKEVV
jgi:hypothetical protein